MPVVITTGLAGTGKSAVLSEIVRQGYRGIDASDAEWSEWRRIRPAGSTADGPRDEWVWRDERITELLTSEAESLLFLAGCSSIQGSYAEHFKRIILLSATPDRMLDRLEPRWDLRNAGDRFQRYLVLRDLQITLPMLRNMADHEIDTTDLGVGEVAQLLIDFSQPEPRRTPCATTADPVSTAGGPRHMQ